MNPQVAPYARVSTDHKEKELSYEAQVIYFTKLIAELEEWELTDLFAPPGLNGKNVKRTLICRLNLLKIAE